MASAWLASTRAVGPRTFDGEVAGSLEVVGLARVLAGVLLGRVVDEQPEDAVLVGQLVLESLEHLELVLVPADARLGVGELARQLDLALFLLARHVFQLVDPALCRLTTNTPTDGQLNPQVILMDPLHSFPLLTFLPIICSHPPPYLPTPCSLFAQFDI